MASKGTCDVCHDDIEIFAIGQCDHPICYKCCTRMRLLCDQIYCAICRTDITQVMFTRQDKKYAECLDRFKLKKDSFCFENDKIQAAFYNLIGHKCRFCPHLKPMKNFRELDQHMRREHTLNHCDICVRHLKIFTHERKCYDRETLARHKRIGDADDKSFKGHPLCELCDQRYLDRDELARHCRKEHFYCHFCETDGRPLEFFDEYKLLKDHFREQHYLCEEGECWHAQHTNAFRSEIDLKAHKATEHNKSMKKAEARQARTIEVDITLAPRQSYSHGRGGRGRGRNRDRDYDRGGESRRDEGGVDHDPESRRNYARQRRQEMQTAQAVALHLNEIHRQAGSVAMVDRSVIDAKLLDQNQPESSNSDKYMRRTEDFPTLDGRRTDGANDSDDDLKRKNDDKDTLAKKLARASNFSVQDGAMEESDFPTLGGRAGRSQSTRETGVWKSQTEKSEYPSLPKKAEPTRIGNSAAPRTGQSSKNTKQTDSWAVSVGKSTPQTKPVIPVTISSNQTVTQKTSSHHTKTVPAKADFPSLSSIGNSLLNCAPTAPGLSLTRSSTWAGGGHGQPMDKQAFFKPGVSANFSKEDFPTLGNGSTDSLDTWNTRPEKYVPQSKNSDRGRGSRKQPAPMPVFNSSYSDSELPVPKKQIASKEDYKLEGAWDSIMPKRKTSREKKDKNPELVAQQAKKKKVPTATLR